MSFSLNLHLRSAHEKPEQPNQFDSPTDPGKGVTQALLSQVSPPLPSSQLILSQGSNPGLLNLIDGALSMSTWIIRTRIL